MPQKYHVSYNYTQLCSVVVHIWKTVGSDIGLEAGYLNRIFAALHSPCREVCDSALK
jgi:hypothetical protein